MGRKKNLGTLLILAVFLAAAATGIAAGGVIYVDDDGPADGDGKSWSTAFKYLRNAQAVAYKGDVIRVAQGTYKPTDYVIPPPPPPPPPPPVPGSNGQDIAAASDDRTATFYLGNNLILEGGYAGLGAPDPNARDVQAYETILSGDIGIIGDDSDNSYHIVTGSDTDSTAVLDGFTITAGYVDIDTGLDMPYGAGLFALYGSPTLANCTFKDNSAFAGGGVCYLGEGSPTVTNCTFIDNSALIGGGLVGALSVMTMTDCTFSGNFGEVYGGALYNENANATIINCIFSENSSAFYGGAICEAISSSSLYNCLFSGNFCSLDGGAIHYWYESEPNLYNCTFAGNSAPNGNAVACTTPEGGEGLPPAVVRALNCIFWDGGSEIFNSNNSFIAINYSDVQGGWDGGAGNINADPCFVDLGYSGPIAYWKLDEAGGTTAHDSVGTNDATVFGAQWAAGQVEGALSFDGFNDYVRIPENPALTNLNKITLEAWIFPKQDNHWHVLDKGDGDKRIYAEGTSLTLDGRVRYTGSDAFVRSVNNTIKLNKWQHVAMTWSRSDNTTRLYHDGQEVQYSVTTVATGSPLSDTSHTWTIGARGALGQVTFFKGFIDEAAISNQVLSTEGIWSHYYSGFSGQPYPAATMPDYHLLPTSPCINVGDPAYSADSNETDLDGKSRVIAGRIDMGAYEFMWDSDSDGIEDPIDLEPAIYSNGFSDAAMTSGTITNRGDQILFITDEPDNNGVRIKASPFGGPVPASASVCSGAGILTLNAGDEAVATCGSVEIKVIIGIVEISFVPIIGSPATASLSAGNSLNFDVAAYTITAPLTNSDVVVVIVRQEKFYLAPGESLILNRPPVADAGPDQTVEAQAPWGATVTLDGSGSGDADSTAGTNDDIMNFNWYKADPYDPNADVLLASGEIIDCNLPLGEHVIKLDVLDRAGAFDNDEMIILVVDTTPPTFTNIPQDLTVECDGSYNSAELSNWLAGAAAVDNCGSVTITNDFTGLLKDCSATGSATVTWTAEDESGNTTTTPAATFTIVDTTPPVITCPPDVTLEYPADTSVEANGAATAGDICGSATITHSDQWQPGCGNTGILMRTWTATDECGNSSNCVQILTVVDVMPPEFSLSVSPSVLWPPNHKMVLITPTLTVSDKCDATPEVSLVSITVNEADDAKGAGNTSDDIQVGDDGSIYLRAERSGTGNDRIYTITYQAVDDCGNTTVRSATVTVPHDQR